ncbi:hypothetical protein KIPB_001139 [Kipferlia bialata]|uniref:Uncharacterized protein n=1 Tax=Kipferlia bialata TaxID=797122 RepID=A0A9K3GFC3_9EUKA|nr:hypothetical protein KIPB_001139 [Kipferlia bialata]|eukprot:g1139.t1
MDSGNDPRAAALAYLSKYQVTDLLRYLAAMVSYTNPENPRAYCVEVLQQILDGRLQDGPWCSRQCEDAGVAATLRQFREREGDTELSLTPLHIRDPDAVRALSYAISHVGPVSTLSLDGIDLYADAGFPFFRALDNVPGVAKLSLRNANLDGTGWLSSSIPDAVTELDLSHNRIGVEGVGRIGAFLPRLNGLRKLVLSHNALGDGGGSVLAQILPRLEAIQELHLIGCQIEGVAAHYQYEPGALVLVRALMEVPTLTVLDLSDNRMWDDVAVELARALSKMECLTKLYLRRCTLTSTGISAIAGVLAQHPTVTELDLSDNLIGEDGASVLGSALTQMHQLELLDLSARTRISGSTHPILRGLSGAHNLKSLNLCGHNLDRMYGGTNKTGADILAHSLRSLPRLESLVLDRCSLGEHSTRALSDVLPQLESLGKLSLRQNSIDDAAATFLGEAIANMPSLHELDLGHYNPFGDVGMTALSQSFAVMPALRVLNLDELGFGDPGALALCASLVEMPGLTELYLRFNHLSQESLCQLAQALPHMTTLSVLDLVGNQVSNRSALQIAEGLREISQLTKLSLAYGGIEDDGASLLALALRRHTLLTELDISEHIIGEEGCIALAESLLWLPNLTKLNLRGNSISGSCQQQISSVLTTPPEARVSRARELAEARDKQEREESEKENQFRAWCRGCTVPPVVEEVQKCRAKGGEKLHIMYRDIGHIGVAALVQALALLPNLTELHLRSNNIGDIGAACLAQALPLLTHLTRLDLVSNNIGDAGVAALGVGLPQLTSLRQLYLSGNCISDMGAQLLSGALPRMTSLREIHLKNNSIGKAGAAALRGGRGERRGRVKIILDPFPTGPSSDKGRLVPVVGTDTSIMSTEDQASVTRNRDVSSVDSTPLSFRAVLAKRSEVLHQ